MIADHPTPKISEGGGTAYTVNARDYKGVMIVIVRVSVQNTQQRQEVSDTRKSGLLR